MTADPVAVAAARNLLQQIALELAFADPRGTTDAVALRNLVGQLATAVGAAEPALASGLQQVLGWLAGPAGESIRLSPDAMERCTAWQPWMVEAVTAWERGLPLPPPPAPIVCAVADPPGPPPRIPSPANGEPVRVLPTGHDPDIMRMFCDEAADLLRDIEQGVLVLESRPDDPDTLATVFRAFHTFKGNAGLLKLAAPQLVAHELESLLDAARRGTLLLDRDAIDVILAGADVFSRFVAETAAQLDGAEAGRTILLPVNSIAERARSLLSRKRQAVVSQPSAAMVSQPSAAVVSQQSAAAPTPRASSTGGSVRVDTAKLDGLIDLVGELVIAQSMVLQHRGIDASIDEHLAWALGQLRGITRDLQRTTMSLRMVPIRGVFQKMSRLVRDVAAQLGKEIRLVLEGEETELDRTVIEDIADPLIHMIRNSADHGIEPAAARVAVGKPPAGTIWLRAFHQGGFVVISIADDGRGLDPAKIRATAEARGIMSRSTPLEPREVLELIFAPGFSTAEAVTDLSGRGVGMDVVRRNIEKLRGKIEIDSIPGRGTTFTVSIPLTLAIIEGLIVAVGDQRYVIPTLSVVESFRPKEGKVSLVHGRGELVEVRGRQVPLLRLGPHLGVPGAVTDPTRGIVVVVESGSDSRCLLVDDLVGRQEVVIKGLGEMFPPHAGFAGAAILGDGRVGLILDTTAIVRLKPRNPEAAA
ncbi:MAG: chemotaxis protein CheA [Planctomycetes bacterium]|nr:chemotaxis protein CheA [Planctomycetota bacterium]